MPLLISERTLKPVGHSSAEGMPPPFGEFDTMTSAKVQATAFRGVLAASSAEVLHMIRLCPNRLVPSCQARTTGGPVRPSGQAGEARVVSSCGWWRMATAWPTGPGTDRAAAVMLAERSAAASPTNRYRSATETP
jgi:hypothetical protein